MSTTDLSIFFLGLAQLLIWYFIYDLNLRMFKIEEAVRALSEEVS